VARFASLRDLRTGRPGILRKQLDSHLSRKKCGYRSILRQFRMEASVSFDLHRRSNRARLAGRRRPVELTLRRYCFNVRGSIMRAIITAIALLSASSAIAAGQTCSDRAQNCVFKWGGPKAACYEAFRLAACEKTGRYVAPNGNIWPAVRVSKDQGH